MKKLLFAVFIITTLCCCNKNAKILSENTSTPIDSTKSDTTILIEKNQFLADLALFISGKEVPPESELYNATKSVAWKNYCTKTNNIWAQFNNKIKVCTKWAEQEIHPNTQSYKTLFSPFSGSDFLYANIFFPNIDTIYLFGLESVGSLPSIDSLYSNNLKNYLDTVFASTTDILSFSFFLTKNMKNDLSNVHLDGVTPLLLIFLTQSNKEVLNLKYGTIDENGHFRVLNPDEDLQSCSNKLVEVSYRNYGENKSRVLYYTGGTNVENYSLKSNKKYIAFLNNLPDGCATFIKSASYLMHEDNFSTIKDIVLTKSDYILQDDSGIPYRYFDSNIWNKTLYGNYSKPITMFIEYEEKDLAEAYSTGNPKPLGFRIGYHRQSNEQVYQRKK